MKSLSQTTLEPLLRKLLRPLVSMWIKNSVQYRRMCQLLKEVYIEVAAEEYGKHGRPTNTTRIALLTGLDRKEIKRIRDQQAVPAPAPPPQQSGALARVLSAWFSDPDFSTDGKPHALDIAKDFPRLCKKYGGDITRTALLNELLRVRAVRTQTDGDIIAVSRYYMPEQADPESVARSLDVYNDVGLTLNHNLYRNEGTPSRFEGRASNPKVPVTRIAEFREFIELKGQEFLEEVDQQLSNYEAENNKDTDTSVETARLGLGLYWIESKTENPE